MIEMKPNSLFEVEKVMQEHGCPVVNVRFNYREDGQIAPGIHYKISLPKELADDTDMITTIVGKIEEKYTDSRKMQDEIEKKCFMGKSDMSSYVRMYAVESVLSDYEKMQNCNKLVEEKKKQLLKMQGEAKQKSEQYFGFGTMINKNQIDSQKQKMQNLRREITAEKREADEYMENLQIGDVAFRRMKDHLFAQQKEVVKRKLIDLSVDASQGSKTKVKSL